MDKKQIAIIAVVALITGLTGFYCGRYYQSNVQRKRIMQMRNNFQGGGGFRQGQGQGRFYYNGQNGQGQPLQGQPQGQQGSTAPAPQNVPPQTAPTQ